ncbi:MAG TPA: serine/threonine protein kinase [Burkholderiales bacterium]|nr:serine/threonine protein kinase [Burkholderiales bacterium]
MSAMPHPYANLTPDCMLDAVESCGYRCDGRQLALNSFENRVYLVYLEEGAPLVAKFYRPERWSDGAILEEHEFALELEAREIPVVAPLRCNGRTLHEHAAYRFALYPRRPGRSPELENRETLTWLGRFIARMHAVGAMKRFAHRPAIDLESFGSEPSRFVIENGFIPPDLSETYRTVVEDVLSRVARCESRAGDVTTLRLHGDCHAGNILWTEAGPHFVDLDDARTGPAVQDLWMCLSGDRRAMEMQLAALIEGYREFYDFDPAELALIEALRTLRMVHYAGWLARRWSDPAFPANFPFFNTQRYWQDHVLALREQAALLDEAPLELLL